MEQTLIELAEIGNPSVHYDGEFWWAVLYHNPGGGLTSELRTQSHATPSEAVQALDSLVDQQTFKKQIKV